MAFVNSQMFRELNDLSVAEFGRPFDVEVLNVWYVRIGKAADLSGDALSNLPLEETALWIKKTAPPTGMFGAPNTLGEILRLLEITESHRETSPEVLEHARNRLAVLRATDGYKRLVSVAKKQGIM